MRVRRSRNEPIRETQLISLADIAFLIIFFFMLSSTFMRDKLMVAIPLLPKSAESVSPLLVTVDKDKQMYLNGTLIGSADALERELKGLLREKTGTDAEVRLQCEKTLTYKDYRDAYAAISHAGGVIAIVHEVPKR